MPINYKHYPKDWKSIRQRILERDQYRCAKCKVENYTVGYRVNGEFRPLGWAPNAAVAKVLKASIVKDNPGKEIITIILTVAHLDHDEWNHEVTDDRLAAFCQRCHFHYDRADNNNRKKYGKLYKKNQLTI